MSRLCLRSASSAVGLLTRSNSTPTPTPTPTRSGSPLTRLLSRRVTTCTPRITTTTTTTTTTLHQGQHGIAPRFMSTSADDLNDGVSGSSGVDDSTSHFGSKPLYAPYTIFKTRAAMTIRFVPPIIQDRGAYQVLKRPGSIQLEIANASGERQYDWNGKEVFQLNVSEIGDILSQQAALAPITSTVECKYTHDPGLQSVDAGQIRKTLSIRRGSAPNKTPGFPARGVYFVNLSVRSRQGETAQFNMQLSDGEFTIMTGLMQNCIPHLFAWSHVVTPSVIGPDPPSTSTGTSTSTRTASGTSTSTNNSSSSPVWVK